MEEDMDELMEDFLIHEVYFQFDEEEPIKMAYVSGGSFSLVLETGETDEPEVVFADGKGKEFKIFLKKG